MQTKKFFLISLFVTINISFNANAQLGMESYGKASFYANFFYGRTTSNGEKLLKTEFTAAHRTLPFGTMLEVTNIHTGKRIIVRVNDRGPFRKHRIVDLSFAAAKELRIQNQGLCNVKIRVVGIDSIVQLSPDDVVQNSTSLLALAESPHRGVRR